MKIKKGDTVQLMIGKDAGKRGKVLRVDMDKMKILIEGLNLIKKHKKPRRQGEKGEIISVPQFVHVAKAMVICPNCNKPIRVGFHTEKNKKSRICKKCKATI